MKKYTFTWRQYSYRRPNSLRRFTLRDIDSVMAIDFFVYELSRSGYEFKPYSKPNTFRLYSCGRLIARSATYQGV